MLETTIDEVTLNGMYLRVNLKNCLVRFVVANSMNEGFGSTAGNLVFQGAVDSKFSAYSAKSGTLLWSYDTQAPALAPPLSYAINGRQYVTILTGLGSVMASRGALLQRYNIDYRTGRGTIKRAFSAAFNDRRKK
jgi:outer membrane protein assembly factor BamB